MQSSQAIPNSFHSHASDIDWRERLERHFPDRFREGSLLTETASQYSPISLDRIYLYDDSTQENIQKHLDHQEFEPAFFKIKEFLYNHLKQEAKHAFYWLHDQNNIALKEHLESLSTSQLVECLQARDACGNTLLHRAAILGCMPVIQLLLETPSFRRVIPNSIWQPVMTGDDSKQVPSEISTSGLFMDEECPTLALNYDGYTPLSLAMQYGHTGITAQFYQYALQFPPELVSLILSYLPRIEDLFAISLTNKQWNALAETEWNKALENHFPELPFLTDVLPNNDLLEYDRAAESRPNSMKVEDWQEIRKMIREIREWGHCRLAFLHVVKMHYSRLEKTFYNAFWFIHQNDTNNLNKLLDSMNQGQLFACLQARDVFGNTMLHRAAILGRVSVVKLLLGTEKFKQAILVSMWEDMRERIQIDIVQQSMIPSGPAQAKNMKLYSKFKNQSNPRNCRGRTAFDEAIVHGHTPVVAAFLHAGLKLNDYWHYDLSTDFPPPLTNDDRLKNPLYLAFHYKRLEIANLLKTQGLATSTIAGKPWLVYAITNDKAEIILSSMQSIDIGADFMQRNSLTDEILYASLCKLPVLRFFIENFPSESEYKATAFGRHLLSKITFVWSGQLMRTAPFMNKEARKEILKLIFDSYGKELIDYPDEKGRTWIQEMAYNKNILALYDEGCLFKFKGDLHLLSEILTYLENTQLGVDFNKKNRFSTEVLFASLLSPLVLEIFLKRIPEGSEYKSLDFGRQLLSELEMCWRPSWVCSSLENEYLEEHERIQILKLILNTYGLDLMRHPNSEGKTWMEELHSTHTQPALDSFNYFCGALLFGFQSTESKSSRPMYDFIIRYKELFSSPSLNPTSTSEKKKRQREEPPASNPSSLFHAASLPPPASSSPTLSDPSVKKIKKDSSP